MFAVQIGQFVEGKAEDFRDLFGRDASAFSEKRAGRFDDFL